MFSPSRFQSQYKSLLVSYRTTAEELVQLLLNCYSSKENPKNYAVHEVNKNPYSDRLLDPDEFPLLAQSEWPRASRHNYAFVLRRNMSRNVFLRAKVRITHLDSAHRLFSCQCRELFDFSAFCI